MFDTRNFCNYGILANFGSHTYTFLWFLNLYTKYLYERVTFAFILLSINLSKTTKNIIAKHLMLKSEKIKNSNQIKLSRLTKLIPRYFPCTIVPIFYSSNLIQYLNC